MNSFVFEIYSEEIPYHIQISLIKQWNSIVSRFISDHELNDAAFRIFATPMRVSVLIESLPNNIKSKAPAIKGPSTNVNNEILDKFLAKHDNTKNYEIREEKGRKFYYIKEDVKSIATLSVLPVLCDKLYSDSAGPNMMRWNNTKKEWFRPIKNILALFNNEVVDYIFDSECLSIKSTNKTYGHRFLNYDGVQIPVEIKDAKNYVEVLKDNNVILGFEQRRLAILEKTNCTNDDLLLDEVAGLVEWVNVLECKFDEGFLKLPSCIIRNVLSIHQKCFLKEGANKFFVVSNSISNNCDEIIRGNELVVKARLTDAMFFWENDLNISIDHYYKKLKDKIYHESLGSIWCKLDRMISIAKYLNQDIIELIKVSKIDLCMQSVNEMPELEYLLAEKYLKEKNYQSNISFESIKYQKDTVYQIITNSSSTGQFTIPFSFLEKEKKLGIELILLDSLEKICAFYSIGIEPKGAKDPFALRRAANNVVMGYLVSEHYDLFGIIKCCLSLFKSDNTTLITEMLWTRFDNFIHNDLLWNIIPLDYKKWDMKDAFIVMQEYQNVNEDLFLSTLRRIKGISLPILETSESYSAIFAGNESHYNNKIYLSLFNVINNSNNDVCKPSVIVKLVIQLINDGINDYLDNNNISNSDKQIDKLFILTLQKLLDSI